LKNPQGVISILKRNSIANAMGRIGSYHANDQGFKERVPALWRSAKAAG